MEGVEQSIVRVVDLVEVDAAEELYSARADPSNVNGQIGPHCARYRQVEVLNIRREIVRIVWRDGLIPLVQWDGLKRNVHHSAGYDEVRQVGETGRRYGLRIIDAGHHRDIGVEIERRDA